MITANFQERNLCTALSGKKNPARGPYRKTAGPVTCAWLANQIRGFRNPARSDAWEKNNNCNIYLDPLEMCDSSHPVGQPLDAEHLSQHSVHCSCRFQLEQQDYKLCSFNFTPVSVTIFSVFWQKSCYRLTNAANFRPPLTFDASWCERRESNSHKGRLDPVL